MNNIMTINVKFFASLKDQLQLDKIALNATGINTVEDVWDKATQNASKPDNLLCAINQQHASLSTAVNNGDEVAFFPPVTGG